MLIESIFFSFRKKERKKKRRKEKKRKEKKTNNRKRGFNDQTENGPGFDGLNTLLEFNSSIKSGVCSPHIFKFSCFLKF